MYPLVRLDVPHTFPGIDRSLEVEQHPHLTRWRTHLAYACEHLRSQLPQADVVERTGPLPHPGHALACHGRLSTSASPSSPGPSVPTVSSGCWAPARNMSWLTKRSACHA